MSTLTASVVTYTKNTDIENGTDTFTCTFTFPNNKGLIRIVHDRKYPDSCQSGYISQFTIKRSTGRKFRIECVTSSHAINKWDSRYPNCPFWFDAYTSTSPKKNKNGNRIIMDQKFGGGNRVLVDIRPVGGTKIIVDSNYTIYVPDGFELEVDIDAKLIDFENRKCDLRVICNKVNRCGYSGGGGSWVYNDFGSLHRGDPRTKLVNTGDIYLHF